MLIGVTFVVAALLRLVPGDPAVAMLADYGGQEDVEELRRLLSLDRPLLVQYGVYLGKLLQGDLGTSIVSGRTVASELKLRLPTTLQLGAMAVLIGVIIGIPAGVIAATRQDTPMDYGARLVSIAGLALPDFWIGTLVIVVPVILFGWLPPIGGVGFFEDPAGNLATFALPALILGGYMAAGIMRMTRSQMLEVMRQDYVLVAYSKGLSGRRVVWGHALKNALIPVVTVIGLLFGKTLGGIVVLEHIFVLPGVGEYLLDSVSFRDYPVVQSIVLVFAGFFVLINLAVDLTYAWLDPRIRYA